MFYLAIYLELFLAVVFLFKGLSINIKFFSIQNIFSTEVPIVLLKKELVWFRIQQSLDPNLVLSESVTLVME